MDQFMPERLRDEVDCSTGKRVVDWVRFSDIAEKWNEAYNSDDVSIPQEYIDNADEFYEKLKEQEHKEAVARDQAIVPNFIEDMKNALTQSLGGMNEVRESQYSNGGMMNSGMGQDPMGYQQEREMNRAVMSVSGADKLIGW